jgi:catechol 1,2-dioxygenase
MTDQIYFSEEKSEEAVIARMDRARVDPRLHQVMASLVKHLHAFIKDVEPTNKEWMQGIKFLTETGQMCGDWRQEFILLSDTLGVSMLVETVNNRKPSGATEATVLGPFYVEGAPHLEHGANISLDLAASPTSKGDRLRGRCSMSGRPTRMASTTSNKKAYSRI